MLTLRPLGEAELRLLYRERMRRDFPESELKPLDTVLSLYRAGVYDALSIEDDGEPAAYALVYRRRGGRAPLLDYFAVEPAKRGQGTGGGALRLLMERYRGAADALFIECERPEDTPNPPEARARIRFYGHAGAALTDLRVTLFGVEFLILCLPLCEEGAALDCEGELLALYRDMLAPAVFERCVYMRREGSFC